MRRKWMKRVSLATSAILLLLGSAAAEMIVIEVEGESYTSGEGGIGGYGFFEDFCLGASGYYMLGGLDWPGEWVGYDLYLPCTCEYEPILCAQGHDGTVNTLKMTFIERDEPEIPIESIFQFSGQGHGCDFPFPLHEGSISLSAIAGNYTVCIELSSWNAVYIDYFQLHYDDTPAEIGTWSLIKTLYH